MHILSSIKTSKLVMGACAAALIGFMPLAAANAGEFGLAITSLYYGPFDGKDDCPEGFALTPEETMLQSVSPAERKAFEERDKRVGSLATYVSRIVSNRRAPDGRDLCEAPTAVNDPPMRIGKGKVTYGMDLDGGDRSSHADHAEYTSPEGKPGIDNQVARLTSCMRSVRVDDNRVNQSNDSGIRNGTYIILIRVSNVDDMQNDDSVTVEYSKSADKFIKDGAGVPLPDATMRADNKATEFHMQTTGKIVNGVLMTDPVDTHFIDNPASMFLRGARFQISMNEKGYGEGMLAGYFDKDSFWDSWARSGGTQQQNGYSCPALYKAMNELADGYKDPKIGEYTALSAAFKIKAVRTFVTPVEKLTAEKLTN